MPALNFQSRFADAVESGAKTQTIRRIAKRRPIQPGDTLYLYTGQRTKHCRKLREAKCTSVTPITIYPRNVSLGGRKLTPVHSAIIALNDGFHTYADMLIWFQNSYPTERSFRGVLIQWAAPQDGAE